MKRPLRILYHHRIRSDDGQAVHVRELIHGLRGEGHEVLECALVPKSGPAAADAPRPADGGRPAAHARGPAGGLWQRLQLPRRAVELLEIVYGRTAARRLAARAAAFRPDVIYERHALHCAVGHSLARRLGVPLLLEVNAPLCDEVERFGQLRFPRLARRNERRVLGGADRVLAVSAALKAMLLRCGASAERTVVIPNGVDPARFDAAARARGVALRRELGLDDPGCFVLGFVGYMRPWNRVDLAVEAMTRPGLEAVRLLLVGEGPALAAVLEAATQRGVRDRVVTVGAVAPGEVPDYVTAFDAALIPALNGYASPLKLFDYLAAGVPTLGPAQPNLAELLQDSRNGLLFTVDDPASLASRLRSLVGDRAGARRLGEAGRRWLLDGDWTWSGAARRVERVAREVLAERAAGTRPATPAGAHA